MIPILKDYRLRHELSRRELADLLGYSEHTIKNWRTNADIPVEACPKIERATGGEIRMRDLRPDVYGDLPSTTEAAA